jgi:biopolymer transport protein TolR
VAGAEHGPVAKGAGIKVRASKSVQSDINVTPLIDVVLVLLIIFMVLTPILIEQMAVNLPDKTEVVEEQDLPEQQLVAATCGDGTYALNRQIMELPALQAELVTRLRSRSSKIVFVDAHPDVDYSKVVDLIDAVRAAGADKVGMATLKTTDEFEACSPAPVAALPTDGTVAPDGTMPTNTVPPAP